MKNPFYRKPDVLIGGPNNPYMRRWHLIPKNRFFKIFLHHFLRDDMDRALHDHPWPSLSIILKGSYIEHLPGGETKIYKAGSFIYRSPRHAHRIELFKDKKPVWIDGIGDDVQMMRNTPRPAWTLFITGPKIREWGFHCPQGWRHWKEFVDPNDHGEVGPGCD